MGLQITDLFTAPILNKLHLRSILGILRGHENIPIYSLSINALLSGYFFLKFSYYMNNKIVMEKKKKKTRCAVLGCNNDRLFPEKDLRYF